jgi:Cation transporter/ATPase, N-terminus
MVVCSGARSTAGGGGETGVMNETIEQAATPAAALDPTEVVEDLLRSLKTHTEGLGSREAQRRLAQYGPNQLQRRGA